MSKNEITRTIKRSQLFWKTVEIVDGETEISDMPSEILIGEISRTKAIKYLEKIVHSNEIVVLLTAIEVSEEVRAISLVDFMAYSKPTIRPISQRKKDEDGIPLESYEPTEETE